MKEQTKTIVEDLPVASVFPSDFKPQIQRSKRFTDEAIEAFSQKIIASNGIINPITVRKIGDKWQIVAGERRWRGTVKAGFPTIPAVIKEIDDETAYNIQLQENLEREDLHPMDEAYTYQDIKEHFKYETAEQVATHVGKPLDYVKTRLKLNHLHKDVKTAFEANHFLLGHALEIGKYPTENQPEVMQLAFTNNALKPVKLFQQSIASQFLLQLDKAIFSKEATNLRKDGLACINCPKRTGAEQDLFGDAFDKKDCCMDRICFNGKIEMSILRKREEVLAADFGVDITKPKEVAANLSKVPLICDEYYLMDRDKPKESYLGYYDWNEIKSKKGNCKFARKGVIFTGSRRGEVITFCNSTACPTHAKKSAREKSELTDEQIEAELQKKRARREEILDSKLEPARLEILKQAAENFDTDLTIATHPNSGEYMLDVLARMWQLQKNYSSRTARDIAEILGAKYLVHEFYSGFEKNREDISKLDAVKKSRLFFLLITAFKGELHEGSYSDQTPIIEIAETFGVNHKLIDAKERAKHISKKNMPEYKKYLDAVEAGDLKVKLPRFFKPDYVPPKEKK